MRSTTRYLVLGLASVMLAACSHKDKDAPLAFVPADTPYVAANLEVLDDSTRKALFARANARLPADLARLDAAAKRMAKNNPDGARLLRAFRAEFTGKTMQQFAQDAGIAVDGHSALYGLGLAPVLRFDLSDSKAFDGFVGRLESAYGKKLDVASIGKQSYRKYAFAASGTQMILAVVDQQAVIAWLPGNAAPTLLRQALGLDRPQKSLQQDGRLAKLAKAKGYQPAYVGYIDLTRALPLALGGKDALLGAIRTAHAKAESAKTGEPVANQLQVAPSCSGEAARIAARVPSISFGYTRLSAKQQDMRVDVALADDISQAFAGIQVALPGLGGSGGAPFDLSLALPVAQLRTFWMTQVDAVAAHPFTCPHLTDINDSFAKLGPTLQKSAIPPFGNMSGVRIALDSLTPGQHPTVPSLSGRLVLGTSSPAGVLAMGQMMVPALAKMKLATDGKPLPLPKDMLSMLEQPAWLAMSDKALVLGVGAGEDAKLGSTLQDPVGTAGQMARMHLTGAMYLDWVQLMETKVDTLAAASAAISQSDDPSLGDDTAPAESPSDAAARSKAHFAALKAQAQSIDSIDAEMHVDQHGMVITTQTAFK